MYSTSEYIYKKRDDVEHWHKMQSSTLIRRYLEGCRHLGRYSGWYDRVTLASQWLSYQHVLELGYMFVRTVMVTSGSVGILESRYVCIVIFKSGLVSSY